MIKYLVNVEILFNIEEHVNDFQIKSLQEKIGENIKTCLNNQVISIEKNSNKTNNNEDFALVLLTEVDIQKSNITGGIKT